MNENTEVAASARTTARRDTLSRLVAGLRGVAVFASGVAAALLALYLYNVFNPPARPLTIEQVNTAISQAIASVTPAPAFSTRAYSAIQPSLVFIEAERSRAGWGVPPGLASGVLVSEQGEILTALHAVANASSVQVTFADGTKSNARVASSKPEIDIAVLVPDQLPGALVPATIGNSSAVRVGDEAYAVGSPFGLQDSLTTGVISGLDRDFDAATSGRTIEGLLQFDAAVNPGSSGGPLVDRDGHVIGIVVSILNPTDDGLFVGIGFAVPIAVATGGDAGLGPRP